MKIFSVLDFVNRVLALNILVTLGACATVGDHGIIHSPEPSRFNEQALAVHERSLVLDAHADIVIDSTSRSYLSPNGAWKVSPDKLSQGGVGAVVMSLAVGPGPRTAQADAQAREIVDEKLKAVHTLLAASC